MIKKTLLIFTIVIFSITTHAQETADTLWKFNGVATLNFSQMSLSNWTAGGENSVAANGIVNLNANYISRNEKANWSNELLLGYGLISQNDKAYRKSNDKIDLASKFGYRASKKWYYSALLSFKTQFAKGYFEPEDRSSRVISNFLSPGYLNLSFGMDYKPSKNLTLLIAPVTGKMTFVADDSLSAKGSFGLDAGQKIRSEFGGYIKIAYTKEIIKNVKLNTKIDLFSNYIENPQYVDVNFDLLLSFKVNDFISASFITQLIYDHDIQFDILDPVTELATGQTEARVQLKELFGIGLTYSF